MKKSVFLSIVIFLFCFNIKATNVTIIESQSNGHTMDSRWDSLLTSLGYTSGIFPQTTLDNTGFFSTTDVLIISSGVIALPVNRVNTIRQFLLQGGNVYLQAEYLSSYSGDSAFQYLVNSLGGGFNWTSTVSGTLAPMNISGTIATMPNAVSPLSYFWYGCAGNACSNIEPFLEYQGDYFGFAFCSPSTSVGKLITTSDQDWIQSAQANDYLLMENIFYRLIDATFTCTGTVFPYLNLGNDTTLCAGDSLMLNASSGFTSYLWNSGSTDSTLNVTTAGTYWVSVTTPCNTYMDTINISLCSGIDETTTQNLNFNIFPNPSSGKFTIQSLSEKISRINITSLSGQTILKEDFKNNFNSPIKIDLTNQSIGIYLIQVITDKEVKNQKIILD